MAKVQIVLVVIWYLFIILNVEYQINPILATFILDKSIQYPISNFSLILEWPDIGLKSSMYWISGIGDIKSNTDAHLRSFAFCEHYQKLALFNFPHNALL